MDKKKKCAVSLYPDGLTSWVDINKFILVDTVTNQSHVDNGRILKSGLSELLVCELHETIQYSSLRRIILSFRNVEEEKNSNLPTILLVSSFQNKATGVESRWYMKPSPSD